MPAKTRKKTTGKAPSAAKKTTAPRPRRGRPPGRGRGPTKAKMPFSLILDPGELGILRTMADRDGTSVAAVIRKALHTVIFKSHPDLARSAVENDVDSFLDAMGAKIPSGVARGARRDKLRKQLVSGLLGTKRRKKK